MEFKPVTDEAVNNWILGLECQEFEGEPGFDELIFTSGICHAEAGTGTEDTFNFGEKEEYRYVFKLDENEEWSGLEFRMESSFMETACSDWFYISVAALKGNLAYIATACDEDAVYNRQWDVWVADFKEGETFLHREGDSWIMLTPKRKDATALDRKKEFVNLVADRKTVIIGDNMLIAVKNDGRVYYTPDFSEGSTRQLGEWSENWEDIIAITMVSASDCAVAGLRADGSVVICGLPGSDSFTTDFFGGCRRWRDIVAISGAYRLLVGLKADGTVVATGDHRDNQCDVQDFSDIVQIGCGQYHTVGLRSDGTVMAAGRDNKVGYESPMGFIWYEMDDPRRFGGPRPECRVEDWRDIEEIRAENCATFGRRSDGVWLETGDGVKNFQDLKEGIYSLKLDNGMVVKLRRDGTLNVEGSTSSEISKWADIRLPENLQKGKSGSDPIHPESANRT